MIRRQFLRVAGAVSLTGCAAGKYGLATADTSGGNGPVITPTEPEGPFYPVSWQGDIDGNLLRINDRPVYRPDLAASDTANGILAAGHHLVLIGRVLRRNGAPAAGASVDIWQADHEGRYRHPADAGQTPWQAGFQGYGRVQTDAQGRYRFITIKPAHYGSRPPHIHFRVQDGPTRLTTQMYFSGENAERGVFARLGSTVWSADRSLLTITPQVDGSGMASGQFDIYL